MSEHRTTHREAMDAWQTSLGVPLAYETSGGTVRIRFRSCYRGEADFDLSLRGVEIGRVRNLVDDRFAPGRAGQWVVLAGGCYFGPDAASALDAAREAGSLRREGVVA